MFRKYMTITAFGLLLQLIKIGWGQVQSPCSNVFQYVRNGSTGDIEGYIEIHRVPIGVAVHIKMSLSVAVALPTKYVGKLELAVPRERAIEAILQGRPLTYRVRFPLQNPVPLVTRIEFNNEEYCSGRRAIGPIVTSITLEHTLFPPGVVPQLSNPSIEVQTPSSYPNLNPSPIPSLQTIPTKSSTVTDKPSSEQNIVPVQTTEFNWNLVPIPTSYSVEVPNKSSVSETGPSLKPNVNDPPQQDLLDFGNCGRPKKSDINLLISKGDRTQPGDWPWLVAIFVSRIKLEFQCAGSLLTNRHVLTAAHCLKTSDNQELPASTLLAVVGRYKLRGWTEKGSMPFEVLDFKVHAEYGRVGAGFDYDLAVITLMETVTFGRLIMPICLWSGPPDIDSIVGKTGFVLGWGRDEQGNPVTEEPRIAKVPIVSQEVCLRSNADFVEITSNRTFCGGSRDGSGPCNGDSGGGLVMYDRQNRRYHLRGVVSLSLLDRVTGACDLSQFVVYTDVAKYLPWIQEQIRS